MCGVKARTYKPDPARRKVYDELYPLYRTLHDAFGVKAWQGSLYPVMKSLLAIRDRVLAGK
jgi:L-ribulokinase